MAGLHYDLGVLVGAARGDRAAWRLHERALRREVVPVVVAPVLVDAFREVADDRLLDRLLSGCAVSDLTAVDAPAVGRLLARAGGTDLTAAALVLAAARSGAAVATTRAGLLRPLSRLVDSPPALVELPTD